MDWRRSSRCASADCVEVAWNRSNRCDSGDCVEVGWVRACDGASACVEVNAGTEMVGMRDSKDPGGPELWFPADAFADFIAAVKSGEL